MGNFNFSNEGVEPGEPHGKWLWLFRHPGTDETQIVPASTKNAAWEGIRYYKGEAWHEWILRGREDLIENGFLDPQVSATFANRHGETVKFWSENDEQ